MHSIDANVANGFSMNGGVRYSGLTIEYCKNSPKLISLFNFTTSKYPSLHFKQTYLEFAEEI